MELLFAGLAGLAIGALAGFAARHRELLGAVLPAAIGGIAALVMWELLTWLGAVKGFGWLAYDKGWIWWITLAAAAIASAWIAVSLAASRAEHDADLLDRLSHVGRIKPRRRRPSSATAASGGATAAGETASDAQRDADAEDAEFADADANAEVAEVADADADATFAVEDADRTRPAGIDEIDADEVDPERAPAAADEEPIEARAERS